MVQLDINSFIIDLSKDYLNTMQSLYKEGVLRNLDEVLADVEKYKNSVGKIQLCKQVKGKVKRQKMIKYSLVVKYVELIKMTYDTLLILNPSQFQKTIGEFSKLVKADSICKKIYNVGNCTAVDSIGSRIVKAMQYEIVRDKVFPKYVKSMEIKSCVYCNANYTIADKEGNGYFDLDHWKPKVYYPFLCTSFFNLQPCCPSCNRRKGADISNLYFSLWKNPNRKIASVIRFEIDENSLIDYLLNDFDEQNLKLNIESAIPKEEKICHHMKQRFHLDALYREHVDVVEEVVWKSLSYRPSYLEGLSGVLGTNLSSDDLLRLVIGVFPNEKDVHKRPLSKVVQDVARQLKMY